MSTPAKLLRWIGMPAFLAVACVGAHKTALAIPFSLLPTAYLLYKRQSLPPTHRADLDTLTYIYLGIGTLGMIGVLICQFLLSYGAAVALFGKEKGLQYFVEFIRASAQGLPEEKIQARAAMASDWRYYVWLAFFTYVAAGGVEELLKYAPIAISRWRQPYTTEKPIPKEVYIQYAVAAGLGFGMIEGVLGTRTAVKAGESGLKLALTVFERVVSGAPGHALTGALLAINAARLGDYRITWRSLWSILGGPILYHGSFDFVLFVISALNGNVGWIHPTNPWTTAGMIVLAESIQLTLLWHVRQAWRSLGSIA